MTRKHSQISHPPAASLKKRADFLRLRQGLKKVTPTLILLAGKRTAGSDGGGSKAGAGLSAAAAGSIEEAPRFGYTVTKRIGNAVIRNRVRRRLREAVRLLAAGRARARWDYVVIARNSIVAADFSSILADVARALDAIHRSGERGAVRKPVRKMSGRDRQAGTVQAGAINSGGRDKRDKDDVRNK